MFTLSDDIATLIKKRFINRASAVAMQHATGEYKPLRTEGRPQRDIPWDNDLLASHLAGERSLGHYLLGDDDTVKLFAFDIDLEKNSPARGKQPAFTGSWIDQAGAVHEFDARAAWRDRKHPARPQMKMALMWTAVTIAATIERELQLPVAAAYSGNKGVHVYAFTGKIPASDAFEGAQIIMDEIGEFEPTRGMNFYRHKDQGVNNVMRNLAVEIFPKQAAVGDGYGNLMRLPLGRNMKAPSDPTFFLDLKAPFEDMKPIDPVVALSDFPTWK